MTVKELRDELDFYDDDTEVVFEVYDDFEPCSVTEDRWGNRTVHLDAKVKPTFICEHHEAVHIELGRD